MTYELTSNNKSVKQLSDTIILINPQTKKIVYANENAHKSLGYTRNEFFRLRLQDIFTLGTGDANEKGISDIFIKGNSKCFEIFQKRKDGKLISTKSTLERLKFDDHNYILCFSRTESSKETNELLIENRTFFQTIIESMDYGLSMVDKNYNIVYQNKVVNELFGGIGNKCYRVYENKQKVCDDCPVEKAFEDGRSHNAVRAVKMPSGQETYWQNKAIPFKNAKGDIVKCIEIAKNITETVDLGKLLYQTQKDWDDIFDTIPDMITVHDKDFNIIKANTAAKKILHLPPLGQKEKIKCFQYYHGTENPLVGCPSCSCLKTEKEALFEIYEPYLKTFIEIRAIPRFDKNNNLVGLIHVVRDISERKENELSLKRSKEELDAEHRSLMESHQAMKVLLKQRENDKTEMEEAILSNIKILVTPYVEELKKVKYKSNELDYVRILESNLKTITSSFSKKLSFISAGLTNKEIQVANLIKEGKQSKDIAEMMNISYETVNCHRQNIRKKLGLKKSNISLRTHLLSFND